MLNELNHCETSPRLQQQTSQAGGITARCYHTTPHCCCHCNNEQALFWPGVRQQNIATVLLNRTHGFNISNTKKWTNAHLRMLLRVTLVW